MSWLIGLRLKIMLAIGAVLTFFLRDKLLEARTKKNQRLKDRVGDLENAQAIRDRVRDARAKPMQPDELKYRD